MPNLMRFNNKLMKKMLYLSLKGGMEKTRVTLKKKLFIYEKCFNKKLKEKNIINDIDSSKRKYFLF